MLMLFDSSNVSKIYVNIFKESVSLAFLTHVYLQRKLSKMTVSVELMKKINTRSVFMVTFSRYKLEIIVTLRSRKFRSRL